MSHDLNNLPRKMLAGFELIRHAVAELRAAGVPDAAIASILFNEAGALWRGIGWPENDLRKVVQHAAEVAITGRAQPIP